MTSKPAQVVNDPAATPLVSVVMPAYQSAATLPDAIASILAQDWPRLELIVVDDGSTDGTDAVLARLAAANGSGHALRTISQRNAGAGAARDAGIAAARGDWILLADADDSCAPSLVTALMSGQRRTGADLVFARCRYIEADGSVAAVQAMQPDRPDARDLLRGLMINTPLVRRAAIAAIGGHDHTLPGSIDLDLFVRLAMRRPGAIVALPEVLSDYRRSSGQITSDWRRMEASWRAVRDKALAAGLDVPRREVSVMRGRHCAYWSTLAYIAGDHRAARTLIGEAILRDPTYVVRDELARIRVAACLASCLPERLHASLRDWFNGRRARA